MYISKTVKYHYQFRVFRKPKHGVTTQPSLIHGHRLAFSAESKPNKISGEKRVFSGKIDKPHKPRGFSNTKPAERISHTNLSFDLNYLIRPPQDISFTIKSQLTQTFPVPFDFFVVLMNESRLAPLL